MSRSRKRAAIFVRHGASRYDELHRTPGWQFMPYRKNLHLTPEFLDLTGPGIIECREGADQIATIVAPTQSVRLVTSPQWRAHSTALVIEDSLRQKGYVVSNNRGDIPFALGVRNITMNSGFDSRLWIEADDAWHKKWNKENPGKNPPHNTVVHPMVIKEILHLEGGMRAVFEEDYGEVDRRACATLMELARGLSGTDVVIVTAHEDTVNLLLRRRFNTQRTIPNGHLVVCSFDEDTRQWTLALPGRNPGDERGKFSAPSLEEIFA